MAIKYNGTPITEIDTDNLELYKVDTADTIGEMVIKINRNFENIARHGGGPAGINGTDGTDGIDGEDGRSAEFIYALSNEMVANSNYPILKEEKENLFNFVESAGDSGHLFNNITRWFDNPRGVSNEQKTEYMMMRSRRVSDGGIVGEWIYSDPVIWSHWGEKGMDGDGVEYIFCTDSTKLELPKKENMTDTRYGKYQKDIFNISDFYPGEGWFNEKNKSVAKAAIFSAGHEITDTYFDTLWTNRFYFPSLAWTDDPTGVSKSVPEEYVAIRRCEAETISGKSWGNYSTPKLWANYSMTTRIFIVYYNANPGETVTKPQGGWWNVTTDKLEKNKTGYKLTDGWSDTDNDYEKGKITWISSGTFNCDGENISWSDPVRITGENGEKGEDGSTIEFIYALSDTMIYGTNYPGPDEQEEFFNNVKENGYAPYANETTWYDNARAISETSRTEWVWSRQRVNEDSPWKYSESPVIWAHWGEDGTDGDGVEYIFGRSKNKTLSNDELKLPVYTSLSAVQKKIYNINDFYPSSSWFNSRNKEIVEDLLGSEFNESDWSAYYGLNFDAKWSDNPVTIDYEYPYEWVSIRKSYTDINGNKVWGDFGPLALWSSYNKRTRIFMVYYNKPNTDESAPATPNGGWWNTSTDKLEANHVDNVLTPGWSDTDNDVPNTITWISSGVFDESGICLGWEKPFRITGAKGEKGADGSTVEFIYVLDDDPVYPKLSDFNSEDEFKIARAKLFQDVETTGNNGVKYPENGTNKSTWFDNAQAISVTDKTEYVWSRSRANADAEWSYTEKPVLWARWGEDGTDGDGVEYIFAVTANANAANEDIKLPNENTINGDDILKSVYNLNDFVPNKTVLEEKKEEIKTALNTTFTNAQWNNIKSSLGTGKWQDNPVGITSDYPYQWVSIRKSSTDSTTKEKVWGPFSEPKLWSNYGQGTKIFIVYCNANEGKTIVKPTGGRWDLITKALVFDSNDEKIACNNPVIYWSDTDIDEDGKIAWMSTGTFDQDGTLISWTNPFRITGDKGEKGADGSTIQFIYAISDSMESGINYPDTKIEEFFDEVELKKSADHTNTNDTTHKVTTTTWYDNARAISETSRTEWVWSRQRVNEDSPWKYSESPVIWAHWGEDGTDGDGVEYIFGISQNKVLEENELNLPVYANLADYQKTIFNTNDFYPGAEWFAKNKAKVRTILIDAEICTSENFETKWSEESTAGTYFGLCTGAWKDNPITVGPENPYQWVSIRKSYTSTTGKKEWLDFSSPALWSSYSNKSRIFMVYCNMPNETTPIGIVKGKGFWNVTSDTLSFSSGDNYAILNPTEEQISGHIGVWSDTDNDVANTITWISSGIFDESGINLSWSEPFRLTGDKGDKGADGSNVEYIYALSDTTPNYPHGEDITEGIQNAFFVSVEESESKSKDYSGTTWYDNAQAIENTAGKRTEWVWSRSIKPNETTWTVTPAPVRWAHWGEDGTDGDGVEYIFAVTSENNSSDNNLKFPVYSNLNDTEKVILNSNDFVPNASWLEEHKSSFTYNEDDWDNIKSHLGTGTWSDNPVTVGALNPYQWVSIRKSHSDENGNRVWEHFSEPALWSSYGQRTRIFIVYCNMPIDGESDEEVLIPITPENGWWDVENDVLLTDKEGYKIPLGYSDASTQEQSKHIGTWEDDNIDVENTITWISTGVFGENGKNISWSEPFRITGEKGENGADGGTIEFIYALSDNPDYPTTDNGKETLFKDVKTPTSGKKEYGNTTWYDNAQAIENVTGKKTEYVWSRTRKTSKDKWEYAPKPTLWARWGEDGTDGDGIEYIFIRKGSDAWDSTLNSESSWNTFWNGLDKIYKDISNFDDFYPGEGWFNDTNKTKVKEKLGDKVTDIVWSNAKTKLSLGFTDNPEDLSADYISQYVSIRKSSNGVWGTFSYPSLWSNYSVNSFKSFAFTKTKIDVDLSDLTPTGGSYSSPIPTGFIENNTPTVTWTDGPDAASDFETIWMTTASVKEGCTSISWSNPQRMADSSEFQVEWSATDISVEDLVTINQELNGTDSADYNFGKYLIEKEYNTNLAEAAWRSAIYQKWRIEFSDSSSNAVIMATCQMKNGVWSNWKFNRVKGEKGETGTSISISGNIKFEAYFTNTDTYNETNATSVFNNGSSANEPKSGDLFIVYPKEPNENNIYYGNTSIGGGLYMWKYNGTSWTTYYNSTDSSKSEKTGNAYTSPNGHLILWDGDSWQDVGNIVGPEGPAGKEYSVSVKYANDGTNGSKVFVTNDNDFASAKWVGFLVYEIGSVDTKYDVNNPSNYTWSLFKGQDGYGYEYIFKATSTKSEQPNVPTTSDNTPDYVPSGWTDDPIEPTATNKYIWMCWRYYDTSTSTWSGFIGQKGKSYPGQGKAKLWQMYSNGVSTVAEYFHADTSISPTDIKTPVTNTSYWYNDKSQCGWNKTNRYLFNVEVITYTDGTTSTLEPHFVATWADGIKDVVDYYIVCGKAGDGDYPTTAYNNTSVKPTDTSTGVGGTTKKTGDGEGKVYWTTDVSKASMDTDHQYLWNVSFKTYEDGTYEWTPALILGVLGIGINGEDSIYLDLDNEMDSVQIDESGKVLYNGTYTSIIKMYSGSTTLNIKDCDAAGEDNLPEKRFSLTTITDTTNGVDSVTMKIVLKSGDIIPEYSKIQITATSVNNDKRVATYTLIGTTNSSTYSIVPSVSSIIEKTDGTIDPSTVKITINEKIGKKVYSYSTYNSSNDSKFVLKKGDTKCTNYSISTSGLKSGDKIELSLESGSNIVDKETIYVLKQGKNGENATLQPYWTYDFAYSRDSSIDTDSDSDSSICPSDIKDTDWKDIPPTKPNGEYYLWMRTQKHTVNANGTAWVVISGNTTYSNITGEKGTPGTNGNTPTIGTDGYWYIGGTKTGVKAEGDDGITPTIGDNGNWWFDGEDTGKQAVPANGVGISGVTEYYLASTQSTGITTSTSGWATNKIPTNYDSTNKYLWNYEEISYTEGNPFSTTPAVIGVYGKDGKGISSIIEKYYIGSESSGITKDNRSWNTTLQVPTKEKPYLWNYEEITYTDSTTPVCTTPAIIGIRGDDGVKGTDGKLQEYTTYEFAYSTNTNSSSTTAPSIYGSWTSGTPTKPSSGDYYLWMKISKHTVNTSTNKYNDNTTDSYVRVQGEKGERGTSGNYTMIAFCRLSSTPTSLPKGTYDNPLQEDNGWSDGIPENTSDTLWMTTRKFTPNDTTASTSGWSTPSRVQDSETLDIEWSYVTDTSKILQPKKVAPSDSVYKYTYVNTGEIITVSASQVSSGGYCDENGYVNDISNVPTTIRNTFEPTWMAVRTKVNNDSYKEPEWTVTRVKGVDGKDMTEAYLGSVFASIETDPTKAILNGFVGVGETVDNDFKTSAFINGSSTLKDDKHGKILLGAGSISNLGQTVELYPYESISTNTIEVKTLLSTDLIRWGCSDNIQLSNVYMLTSSNVGNTEQQTKYTVEPKNYIAIYIYSDDGSSYNPYSYYEPNTTNLQKIEDYILVEEKLWYTPINVINTNNFKCNYNLSGESDKVPERLYISYENTDCIDVFEYYYDDDDYIYYTCVEMPIGYCQTIYINRNEEIYTYTQNVSNELTSKGVSNQFINNSVRKVYDTTCDVYTDDDYSGEMKIAYIGWGECDSYKYIASTMLSNYVKHHSCGYNCDNWDGLTNSQIEQLSTKIDFNDYYSYVCDNSEYSVTYGNSGTDMTWEKDSNNWYTFDYSNFDDASFEYRSFTIPSGYRGILHLMASSEEDIDGIFLTNREISGTDVDGKHISEFTNLLYSPNAYASGSNSSVDIELPNGTYYIYVRFDEQNFSGENYDSDSGENFPYCGWVKYKLDLGIMEIKEPIEYNPTVIGNGIVWINAIDFDSDNIYKYIFSDSDVFKYSTFTIPAGVYGTITLTATDVDNTYDGMILTDIILSKNNANKYSNYSGLCGVTDSQTQTYIFEPQNIDKTYYIYVISDSTVQRGSVSFSFDLYENQTKSIINTYNYLRYWLKGIPYSSYVVKYKYYYQTILQYLTYVSLKIKNIKTDETYKAYTSSQQISTTTLDFNEMINTVIYEDGTIKTNNIIANGGTFTGEIYATSGKFTGEIQAESGKIGKNVTIGGNINLTNENSSIRFNPNSKYDIIRISNDTIPVPGDDIELYMNPISSYHWTTTGPIITDERYSVLCEVTNLTPPTGTEQLSFKVPQYTFYFETHNNNNQYTLYNERVTNGDIYSYIIFTVNGVTYKSKNLFSSSVGSLSEYIPGDVQKVFISTPIINIINMKNQSCYSTSHWDTTVSTNLANALSVNNKYSFKIVTYWNLSSWGVWPWWEGYLKTSLYYSSNMVKVKTSEQQTGVYIGKDGFEALSSKSQIKLKDDEVKIQIGTTYIVLTESGIKYCVNGGSEKSLS